LRGDYRAALAILEASRARKAVSLYDLYLSTLDSDIIQFTKDNKIEEAKSARAWSQQVAKRREKEVATSSSAAAGGSGGAQATKEAPFVNGLGMKFVPVPGANVLFCIHETRYRDYAAYAAETPNADASWKDQSDDGVTPADRPQDHPVTKVTWREAKAFCDWLGKKEKATYRLPTDREWSVAVGIGPKEAEMGFTSSVNTNTPIPEVYPWGQAWPPPPGSGNFALRAGNADDGFATTSPVMQFKPNSLGIFDLGGNVWELCEDWFSAAQDRHVVRGGSYRMGDKVYLSSAQRSASPIASREADCGFRVVLEVSSQGK
jgi:hypothetical protein